MFRVRSDGFILPPGFGLFLASFVSLFLELLLIRWVPSHVRIVAYYSNLMLISAFLGLGCGILLAWRRLKLYRWLPPTLVVLIIFVFAIKGVDFKQGPNELRYLFNTASSTTTVPIIGVFVLNVLVFVPLGELIGDYFRRLPPLHAYAWDLAGAIAGTALFGLFSYFWFSPILGLSLCMLVYLLFRWEKWHLVLSSSMFVIILVVVALGTDKTAIWSAYNYLTVHEFKDGGKGSSVARPANDIFTSVNPPFYDVRVNNSGYMFVGTIDRRRYDEFAYLPATNLVLVYVLPHVIRPNAKEVLVVGSGGGIDVEAALMSGSDRVDAVEIDPSIVRIGQQYNASRSYMDPRVKIHNNDARAFFKQTKNDYDLIVFGLLDSQGLFAQMSNIRLDSYVHTRESFQEAFSLLKSGGLLSISFYSARKMWIVDRLVTMVQSATGSVPLVYVEPLGRVVILAGKDFHPEGPRRFGVYKKVVWTPSGIPEATDDWPYLYLKDRVIPPDYLTNIAILLAISILFVVYSSGGKRRGIDPNFFFLGAGFLLLETKSITTISLFFGTTWFVSMVVILGVLLMVLLANFVALRLKRISPFFYLPLIATVVFLYLFPTQTVLAWSFHVRLLFSLFVIPLPIFFAGLIFSSMLRESEDPSYALGSNLLGAMVGGFTEYLGMMTGMRSLLLMVLLFYLASYFASQRAGKISFSSRGQHA